MILLHSHHSLCHSHAETSIRSSALDVWAGSQALHRFVRADEQPVHDMTVISHHQSQTIILSHKMTMMTMQLQTCNLHV